MSNTDEKSTEPKRCPHGVIYPHECRQCFLEIPEEQPLSPAKELSTEQLVCDEIMRRKERGLAKYGTTVDRTDLTHEQWQQHLLEELLDAAVYLMRQMRDGNSGVEQLCAADAVVEQRPTPETAKETFFANSFEPHDLVVDADFARTLERQRDEAREAASASIEGRTKDLKNLQESMQMVEECHEIISGLTAERDEASSQRDEAAKALKEAIPLLQSDVMQERMRSVLARIGKEGA